MSTYSMNASQSSQRLAFLRLLLAKAHASVHGVTMQLRFTLTKANRVVATAANATLAVAASHTGYTFITRTARAVVSNGWRIVRGITGWIGRAAHALGRAVNTAVSWVSPRTATTLSSIADKWIATPVKRAAATADQWVTTIGHIVSSLAEAPLVRTVTVRAAQAATAILGLHAATQGRVAAAIVRMMPWTMDAVIALTTPWKTLALVAGTSLVAMAVTLVRFLTARPHEDDEYEPATTNTEGRTTPPTGRADTTNGSDNARPIGEPTEAAVDLDQVAATVTIEVAPDGTVTVHGIPDTLPREDGQRIADIAAKAAEKHLERILRTRRTPNRDDRRLLTKVAREAILDARATTTR